MSQMLPLWSAEQHAWLEALGYAVWIQGALPEPEAVGERQVRGQAASAEHAKPLPHRAPTAQPTLDAATRSTHAVAPRWQGVRMPDRLYLGLIRASGCNPNAPEAAELIATWPATSELRGNPNAKRALWPRLRALRKLRQP